MLLTGTLLITLVAEGHRATQADRHEAEPGRSSDGDVCRFCPPASTVGVQVICPVEGTLIPVTTAPASPTATKRTGRGRRVRHEGHGTQGRSRRKPCRLGIPHAQVRADEQRAVGAGSEESPVQRRDAGQAFRGVRIGLHPGRTEIGAGEDLPRRCRPRHRTPYSEDAERDAVHAGDGRAVDGDREVRPHDTPSPLVSTEPFSPSAAKTPLNITERRFSVKFGGITTGGCHEVVTPRGLALP